MYLTRRKATGAAYQPVKSKHPTRQPALDLLQQVIQPNLTTVLLTKRDGRRAG